MPVLCLASRSPRRAALLHQLGVAFEVVAADVDESALAREPADDYVRRIAVLKAHHVAHRRRGQVVLAADTCVSVDGALYGKPADFADARAMLRSLAGRWHDVHTGVAIDGAGLRRVVVVSTRVEMVAFDDAVIDAYWASGEPADKAGAYAIQGLGGALVRRIEGSYSAVVGLPLAEAAALLEDAGVRHGLSP